MGKNLSSTLFLPNDFGNHWVDGVEFPQRGESVGWYTLWTFTRKLQKEKQGRSIFQKHSILHALKLDMSQGAVWPADLLTRRTLSSDCGDGCMQLASCL